MVPRIVPVKDWASASEAAAARTATTASFFMAAPFEAELMARTRAGDQGSLTLLIFSGLGVNRGIDPQGHLSGTTDRRSVLAGLEPAITGGVSGHHQRRA